MAKIDRYNGNLKAFASEQLTNERTLFGDVTVANDLTSQLTAQFLRGWGIVGPSDQPSLQDFNAVGYTLGQLLAYLHQMGVAEYNAAQEYFIGSIATAGAVLYMSTTNANIGNTPSTSPANWKAFTADQATEVALGLVKIATQALTNAGSDDLTAVTPKKLSAAIQGQKHTSFPTTGTATAQVLTPVPAITSYAVGQRFNAIFNAASGLNPTINVSGLGAKPLKQYDSSGTKVAATFAAQQSSDIFYDGTDFVLLNAIAATPDASTTVKGKARFGTPAEQLLPTLGVIADPAGVASQILASRFGYDSPIDQTANRVSGSTYTNTDTKPRFVSIFNTGAGTSYQGGRLFINGVARARTNRASSTIGTFVDTLYGLIPPGATYSCDLPNVERWTETS